MKKLGRCEHCGALKELKHMADVVIEEGGTTQDMWLCSVCIRAHDEWLSGVVSRLIGGAR